MKLLSPSKLCNYFFILLFSIFFIQVKADTLVQFQDLQYHSDFEKATFNQYQKKGHFDFFKLFLAIDQSIDQETYKSYLKTINENLNSISIEKTNKLKPKKKIKYVYNQVHQHLDKYRTDVMFGDIFRSKEYQCVTASMLYTFYFEYLNIPYTIESSPQHVFLTTYPDTEQIMVETTNPSYGVRSFSDQFKINFVEHIRENKIVSQSEYHSKTTEELFQEYYFQSKSINKKGLASSLYYNLGIFQLEKNDMENAFHSFTKSNFLMPSEINNFFMTLSLGTLLDKTNLSDTNFPHYLNLFAKLTQTSVKSDIISDQFNALTNKLLVVNGNTKQYKKAYQTILNGINDSILINDISFVYHAEMGNQYFNKRKYKQAQKDYEEALKLKENNISVQYSLVKSIIEQKKSYQYNIENLIEFQAQFYQSLDSFPILLENDDILNLKFSIPLELMSYYFREKDLSQATNQQQIFETIADKKKIRFTYYIEEYVERAYSSAAVYYYKKGQYTKAKEVINKGLEYCPKNVRLKLRKDAL